MAKKAKNSRKEFIWAIILLIIVAIFICLYPQPTNVCFENKCFKVETVSTDRDRAIGLSYRDRLDLDKGMLFVFDYEDKHSFWMRNTLIPLDIIWLDANKNIVFIKENAEPCKEGELCETIKPVKPALYVLEVNAGQAKEAGLKIGDNLTFNFK